jgi:pimeloyl-ACP methyl ester carboxylesterase/DNA-binding winged helix-turn-helix (wHTH) protein
MSVLDNTVHVIFQFENAELDTAMFELRVDGARVPVEPQVFEVLSFLVTHRDRLVPRTEILDAVWGDRFVSDSALASRVAAARVAIGDDGKAQRLIRTVHGRGLQFVGDVTVETQSSSPVDTFPQPSELRQKIRFARADDGVELAVATVGDGIPLVKAANWLTHVERDWHSPVWNHWNTELGSHYHYVRYDTRGCGLSDHDLRGSSLSDVDRWVADLETVVDQQELDQFVLFGMSQGGVPAVTYAAKHPERVSHLVLLGCYSRGMRFRGTADEAQVRLDMMRVGWGGRNPAFRSFFTTTMLPEATSEHTRWFNELQRETASTENAILLESAFYDVDLTDVAPQVAMPTLVFHAEADMCAPYAEGRRLASLIPNAEFVTLDTPNHLLMADEPAWLDFLGRLTDFTAL